MTKTLSMLVKSFLVVLLSLSASASQDRINGFTPMCAFTGGSFCLSHSPGNVRIVQHKQYVAYELQVAGQDMHITEYATFPDVRVIPEAFWRMSYLRNQKGFSVLIEQTMDGKTWWDFYLIGDRPTLRVSFDTNKETEIWPLVESVAFQLHGCVAENDFPVCSRLNSLGQMVKGHLLQQDQHMRLKPQIRSTFQHIVDTCEIHIAQECVRY